MIIQDVLDNLKAALEDLSWQPVGNTGTTAFQGVFTAPVLNGVSGSPWVFVTDTGSSITSKQTKGINGETVFTLSQQINISLCMNYGITKSSEEDYKRLRYAQEAVHNYIKGTGNLFNAGFTQGWNYTGWSTETINELKIYIRTLNLTNLFTI